MPGRAERRIGGGKRARSPLLTRELSKLSQSTDEREKEGSPDGRNFSARQNARAHSQVVTAKTVAFAECTQQNARARNHREGEGANVLTERDGASSILPYLKHGTTLGRSFWAGGHLILMAREAPLLAYSHTFQAMVVAASHRHVESPSLARPSPFVPPPDPSRHMCAAHPARCGRGACPTHSIRGEMCIWHGLHFKAAQLTTHTCRVQIQSVSCFFSRASA